MPYKRVCLACVHVSAYIRREAEERERDEVEQHSVHSLHISDDDLIKGMRCFSRVSND